jgi:uncharacterized protein (DUF1697 family)
MERYTKMSIYIALLRGINVGGKNMIKMADLKSMLEEISLSKVQTYIQSGNVLFESSEAKEELKSRIEHEIEKTFSFHVDVIIRTRNELEEIIGNCPFSKEIISEAESTAEGESSYVALLGQLPTQEGIERLSKYKTDDDEYKIVGQEVYLLFRKSIRNSKLAANLHRLDSTSTVRNWKTLSKLLELAKSI